MRQKPKVKNLFWFLFHVVQFRRNLFRYATGETSCFPSSSYTTFIICLPCIPYALLILSFLPLLLPFLSSLLLFSFFLSLYFLSLFGE